MAAAVNPELTYLKVRFEGEVYYVARGAFTANRMEGQKVEADEEGEQTGGNWLPGVPYLKTTLDRRFFPELWHVRVRL